MPHNLPTQLTAFIGRTAERATLQSLLSQPENRLITLLGPGGVGKTRLALAVAEDQLQRSSDHIYFVSLVPVTSWEQMALVLADTIGFTLYGEPSPEDQVFQYLSDKPILLLLDNLEHLVEGAEFITRLLRAAPLLRILATSRERLSLLSETVFTVEGFQIDDWNTHDAAHAADAVRLFLQSARRASAGFTLTDADLPGMSRICRLTGGMPLAIELAAAWVDVLSIDEIAGEIERNYQFLTAQFRDLPARHRSLQATLDSSWERLSPQDQDVLRKMSVFQGRFTRRAAQAISGASISTLQSLVNKSLLKHHDSHLYEIHELLRQYLSDQLDRVGGTEATRAEWSRHYLTWLGECAPNLKGGAQLQALDEIEAEFENIRGAWMAACDQNSPLFDPALESMFLFSLMRNRYQEGDSLLRHAEMALAASDGAANQESSIRAVLYRFWLLRWREGTIVHYPNLLARITDFFPTVQQAGIPHDVALHMLMLGTASNEFASQRERAEALLQGSLERYEALDDRYYVAWALHFLAGHSLMVRGLAHAIDLQTKSLTLRQACGDVSGELYALHNLSLYWLQMGDLERSAALAHQILKLSQEIGERSGQVMSNILLGLNAVLGAEAAEAEEWARRAQRMAADLNHPLGERSSTLIRGLAAIVHGDNEEGRRVLADVQREALPQSMAFFVNLGLAMALIDRTDREAATYLEQAANYALAVQGTGLIAWCLALYAVLAAAERDEVRATTLLSAATPLCGALGGWRSLTETCTLLAQQTDSKAVPGAPERSVLRDGPPVTAAQLLSQAAFGAETGAFPPRVRAANQALIDPLSDRELEILALISQGLQNGTIADRLVIGVSTVKKHISHIYAKLGVTTREQAVFEAQERGLV